MAKRATIYSLAEELGIHPSTVSRAFTRPDLVKDDVRERILAKAVEVDYRPNKAARGLITGRTSMIGLLIPDIANPFFPPLVRAIQQAAAVHDLNVMLLDSEERPSQELDLIRRLRGQIDGLILASPRSNLSKIDEAIGGAPAVVVNRAVKGFSSAVIDNSEALQEAGGHLNDLGHRNVALLRGPAGSWAAGRRARAVRSWAASAEANLIELGPFDASFEGGREAAEQLAGMEATAVFAFDDLMACGVVAGLAVRGLQVPRDLSLIGCDDVLLAQTLTPALTTVTAPIQELGQSAVDLLVSAVAGDHSEPQTMTLQGQLTIRASSAKATKKRRFVR